jgi:hypothetical protein
MISAIIELIVTVLFSIAEVMLPSSSPYQNVGNHVTAKAFNFDKLQQLSTNELQSIQHQSLKSHRFQSLLQEDWHEAASESPAPAYRYLFF